MAERSSALDSSSGVIRMWVCGMALVSLSKTLNHNCFVLRMGHKAVGHVCCVMHVKEPRTLIVKEKGLDALVFLDSRLEHQAWWICARYKSSVLLLNNTHMIRSHCCCCCFSHCVHIKLGHRFHALLKVCPDCNNIVPLTTSALPSL